jgi:molybdopterin molybdotransferase
MLSVAEAEQRVLEAVAPLPTEDCALLEAGGRVLRQPLAADRDLPPFDRVAMDGYALRHDAWRAGVRRWRVAGVQAAGAVPQPLPADAACIEVMTGAALPPGADTVVPYEDAAREAEVMTLAPEVTVRAGQAVHRRGSDRTAGAVIVRPGTRLGGVEIAVAAACGYARLTVTRQPKLAVIATGDELVEVDAAVAPHQIRRSNDYALRAMLVAAGHPQVERFHLRDSRPEIEHLLWHVVAEYDGLVLTGGISKGRFDFVPEGLAALGVRPLVEGVAQRPGKPFWFGVSPRQTPVFALPGNPVSSSVCLHRYVLPALTRMSGRSDAPPQYAALTERVVVKTPLTGFLPVRLAAGAGAERRAAPVEANTSGDFAGLAGTDGFVELPPGVREFAAGTVVRYWAWA